jgi:gamma-glutamylcyclotransferase
MTEQVSYFSYGSNMSTTRLRARISSAKKFATAMLPGHALRFHKHGQMDDSAKCDAFETGRSDHLVHGVVFQMAAEHVAILDDIEGVGLGYEKKEVFVELINGEIIQSFTYYATHIDASLKPLCWYVEHVLRGAREHALPSDYISDIERIAFKRDTNHGRRQHELSSIYL